LNSNVGELPTAVLLLLVRSKLNAPDDWNTAAPFTPAEPDPPVPGEPNVAVNAPPLELAEVPMDAPPLPVVRLTAPPLPPVPLPAVAAPPAPAVIDGVLPLPPVPLVFDVAPPVTPLTLNRG